MPKCWLVETAASSSRCSAARWRQRRSRCKQQELGRIYRLGSLHSAPRDGPHQVAFFDEVRRLGFVGGQNLVWGGFGLRVDTFDEHAAW